MANKLGWKFVGAALLAGVSHISGMAEAAEPAPAAKTGLVCAVEKNTLVLRDAGSNGALRASLDEDGTIKGKTVSGRGMIYDPKDDTKAIMTGVTFEADFKAGTCGVSIAGDFFGSRTLKGQMAVGASYKPANFTFEAK